jgi:hypothetical protein
MAIHANITKPPRPELRRVGDRTPFFRSSFKPQAIAHGEDIPAMAMPLPAELQALQHIAEHGDVITVSGTPWLLVPASDELMDALGNFGAAQADMEPEEGDDDMEREQECEDEGAQCDDEGALESDRCEAHDDGGNGSYKLGRGYPSRHRTLIVNAAGVVLHPDGHRYQLRSIRAGVQS